MVAPWRVMFTGPGLELMLKPKLKPKLKPYSQKVFCMTACLCLGIVHVPSGPYSAPTDYPHRPASSCRAPAEWLLAFNSNS